MGLLSVAVIYIKMQAIVILLQISNTYSTGSEAPADVLLPPMQPRKNSRCKQFITKNVAKQADIGNNLFLFLELRISPPPFLYHEKKKNYACLKITLNVCMFKEK